jgi:hypothetical protein
MQTHQRIVFGNMGGAPRVEQPPPSKEELVYLFNTMIFEIAANWDNARTLMNVLQSGNLKTVDMLERDWLNFIMENQVDILKYENSDQFVEDCFKKINIE